MHKNSLSAIIRIWIYFLFNIHKKVHVFSPKSTYYKHYFYVSYWERYPNLRWSSKPSEGPAVCRAKSVLRCHVSLEIYHAINKSSSKDIYNYIKCKIMTCNSFLAEIKPSYFRFREKLSAFRRYESTIVCWHLVS